MCRLISRSTGNFLVACFPEPCSAVKASKHGFSAWFATYHGEESLWNDHRVFVLLGIPFHPPEHPAILRELHLECGNQSDCYAFLASTADHKSWNNQILYPDHQCHLGSDDS